MEIEIPLFPLKKIGRIVKREIRLEPNGEYKTVGCKLYGLGVYERETKGGSDIQAKRMFSIKENDFLVNRIWAQKGSAGVVPLELDGAVVTNDFPVIELDLACVYPSYISWYVKTRKFWEACRKHSHGTSGRERLSPKELPNIEIPLPDIEEQKRIVARIESLMAKIEEVRRLRAEAVKDAESLVVSARHNLIYLKKANKLKNLMFDKAIGKLRGPKPGLPQKEYKSSGKFPVVDQGKNYIGGYTDDESRVFKVTEPVIVWGDHTTNSKLIDFDFVPGADGTKIFSPKGGLIAGYVNHFLKTVNYPELGYSRHYRYLKNLQIPLCSLPEQRRIVSHLDSLQAKVDELKGLQAETEKELEELVPSILDKAFKGELCVFSDKPSILL